MKAPMHRLGLDTSVVLRLITGEPTKQAMQALDSINEASAAGVRLHVCDLVLSEAYFALVHHYRLSKEETLNALGAFFSTGEFHCTEAAKTVLSIDNLHSAKPGFLDRLIHATYLNQCDGMLTFEHAASRLYGTKVLDQA